MATILLVEDEMELARLVVRELEAGGYRVRHAPDGNAALRLFAAETPDLVVLDWMLPGQSGLALAKRWRGQARTRELPIIMLTARAEDADKIAGLDAGADDYLVKPFELDELNARMRAVLRRHSGRAQTVLTHGGVTLDPATRQVTRDGQPVLLSAREFAVLEALMARPGALLSRAQLEDRLYGWGEEIESNAVSVYIHQLRRKLGADFIQNVRGVGYFVGGPGPVKQGDNA